MTEAEEMKQHLEQQQRDRLQPFTDGKAVYSPRWFMSVVMLLFYQLPFRALSVLQLISVLVFILFSSC